MNISQPTIIAKTGNCSGCGQVLWLTGPYCDAANDELWLCDDCLRGTGHEGA